MAAHHPSPGVLQVTGDDRLDFLNRMSTQALLELEPGGASATIFTTAIGRIVETARVLNQVDRVVLVLAPGRAQPLQTWLQRHIFFQDRVTLESLDGPWTHLGLYGPHAELAARTTFSELPALPSGAHIELNGGAVWPVPQPQPGVEFLLRSELAQRAVAAWPPEPAQAQAYEALRLEAGLPAPGREITDQAIPLEVGLWEAVSFSKGCYIGQEIIARMESRGRQARTLLGVRLEGPAQPGEPVRQGTTPQGNLTSAAESPRLGWIGLALVRPAAIDEAGGRVQVGENGAGQLVELPFT